MRSSHHVRLDYDPPFALNPEASTRDFNLRDFVGFHPMDSRKTFLGFAIIFSCFCCSTMLQHGSSTGSERIRWISLSKYETTNFVLLSITATFHYNNFRVVTTNFKTNKMVSGVCCAVVLPDLSFRHCIPRPLLFQILVCVVHLLLKKIKHYLAEYVSFYACIRKLSTRHLPIYISAFWCSISFTLVFLRAT